MNQQHLNVLIIEDLESDAALVVRQLRKGGYDVTFQRLENANELQAALEQPVWDIIISDHNMPQFDAPSALAILQHSGLDIPFIVVSGTIGEETAVAMMKAGAHDYLIKNNLSRLAPAVERELREAQTRRERRQAEEALKASLAEKEVLLREIHHRVKNNLQVIISLINLQAAEITDRQVLNKLADLQRRAHTMALVHEHLYHSPNLARVDFADYLQTLTNHLLASIASPNRVSLQVHAEAVYLDIAAAVPCGLIVNELVSNALKHAFPQDVLIQDRPRSEWNKAGCVVQVDLHANDDQAILRVSDNGVGLPVDLNWRDPTSLGLQIVQLLTDQIGGHIELEQSGGSAFTITFQLPKTTAL